MFTFNAINDVIWESVRQIAGQINIELQIDKVANIQESPWTYLEFSVKLA